MPRVCPRCKKDESAGASFSSKARYCRECAKEAVKECRERKKTGLPPPKLARKVAEIDTKSAEKPAKICTKTAKTDTTPAKKCNKICADYANFCAIVVSALAEMDKGANFAELCAELPRKIELAKSLQADTQEHPAADQPKKSENEEDSTDEESSETDDAEEPAEIAETAEKVPKPAEIAAESAEIAAETAEIATEMAEIATEMAEIAAETLALDMDKLYCFASDNNAFTIGTDEQTSHIEKRTEVTGEKIPKLLCGLIANGRIVRLIGEERPLSDNIIVITTSSDPSAKRLIACGKYIQFYCKSYPHENGQPGWSILDDNAKNREYYLSKFEQVDASTICDPRYIMLA